MFKQLKSAALAAVLSVSAFASATMGTGPAQAATFDVNLIAGGNSLVGTLETDGTTGAFTSAALNNILTSYTLLSTGFNGGTFTYTEANSDFGLGGFGSQVIFTVTGSAISFDLSAVNSSGGAQIIGANGDVFGTRIRLFQTQMTLNHPGLSSESQNWGTTPTTFATPAAIAPVPLPAGVVLLFSSIVGLVFIRRRSGAPA